MRESEFEAAQAFFLSAKRFWTTTMYRELRGSYEELCEASGEDSDDAQQQALTSLEQTTRYRYFSWLERHLQRMKYTSRFGLIPFHAERRDQLLKESGFDIQDEYTPRLNSDVRYPDYYKSVDIHQHKGHLWTDQLAGIIYEYGARSTTPLLGDAHGDLHHRLARLIAERAPKSQSILDMGCGFGKSTRPFIHVFPSAEIHGVDLSEPCLLVAANIAREAKSQTIQYSQQNAQQTDFQDGQFDLITSTMFLHEIPVDDLDKVFAECRRLLKPGGKMIHLDFYHMPDAFGRFLHFGHATRNNEPFMPGLVELDLDERLAGFGFGDISYEPFAESDDVDLDKPDAWRFPWTVISATRESG